MLHEGLQLHLGVLLLEGGVRGVVLHREDVGFREVALDHQAAACDGEVGLHLIQLEEHVRVFVHAVHELAAGHQEGAAVVAHAHVAVGGAGDGSVQTVHVTFELQLVHLEDGGAGAHQQGTRVAAEAQCAVVGEVAVGDVGHVRVDGGEERVSVVATGVAGVAIHEDGPVGRVGVDPDGVVATVGGESGGGVANVVIAHREVVALVHYLVGVAALVVGQNAHEHLERGGVPTVHHEHLAVVADVAPSDVPGQIGGRLRGGGVVDEHRLVGGLAVLLAPKHTVVPILTEAEHVVAGVVRLAVVVVIPSGVAVVQPLVNATFVREVDPGARPHVNAVVVVVVEGDEDALAVAGDARAARVVAPGTKTPVVLGGARVGLGRLVVHVHAPLTTGAVVTADDDELAVRADAVTQAEPVVTGDGGGVLLQVAVGPVNRLGLQVGRQRPAAREGDLAGRGHREHHEGVQALGIDRDGSTGRVEHLGKGEVVRQRHRRGGVGQHGHHVGRSARHQVFQEVVRAFAHTEARVEGRDVHGGVGGGLAVQRDVRGDGACGDRVRTDGHVRILLGFQLEAVEGLLAAALRHVHVQEGVVHRGAVHHGSAVVAQNLRHQGLLHEHPREIGGGALQMGGGPHRLDLRGGHPLLRYEGVPLHLLGRARYDRQGHSHTLAGELELEILDLCAHGGHADAGRHEHIVVAVHAVDHARDETTLGVREFGKVHRTATGGVAQLVVAVVPPGPQRPGGVDSVGGIFGTTHLDDPHVLVEVGHAGALGSEYAHGVVVTGAALLAQLPVSSVTTRVDLSRFGQQEDPVLTAAHVDDAGDGGR